MVGNKSYYKADVAANIVATLLTAFIVFGVLGALVIVSVSIPRDTPVEQDVTVQEELTPPILPNPDGNYYPLQYSLEDHIYMTEAIYFEARSEPLECQEMVAHVIMTRVYDWYYPNTVKEVVWANKQFSYTHDGKNELMYDYKAKVLASETAHLVLSGLSVDTTAGSLYYLNPGLANPIWKDDYTFVTKCGKHTFYKRKDIREWS